MREPMKKTEKHKRKAETEELRSVDDFNKRFYPEPGIPKNEEFPDAEDVGERLAKESLNRLQAALIEQ
jgi:hypothetical protein